MFKEQPSSKETSVPGAKRMGEGVRGDGARQEGGHTVPATQTAPLILDSGCQETQRSWGWQGLAVVWKESVRAPALAWGSRQRTGVFGETEAGFRCVKRVDRVCVPVQYASENEHGEAKLLGRVARCPADPAGWLRCLGKGLRVADLGWPRPCSGGPSSASRLARA